MDKLRQNEEVDRNYDAFVRVLGSLLPEHRNQYALMRNRQIDLGFWSHVPTH